MTRSSRTRTAADAAQRERPRSGFALVVTGVIVVGVFFIINSSFSGGVREYASLAALETDSAAAVGREIQVSGDVIPGSIRGDADLLDLTFDISDGSGGTLSVHYTKILPDPFAEGRQVIATGVLASPGLLEADVITVKCPSRYQDGAMSEAEAKAHYEATRDEGAR